MEEDRSGRETSHPELAVLPNLEHAGVVGDDGAERDNEDRGCLLQGLADRRRGADAARV